jgi:hypothetical protein
MMSSLPKTCCRAYATNDVQEEDEPEEDQRRCITMEESLTLLRRTFPADKPADIRANLKRSVAFVFRKFALYIRLPSQQENAPIHRIQIQDLHRDLLADGDTCFYGKFKSGTMEKPPDFFAEAVEKEQSMIQQSMQAYSGFGKVQEYVSQVNGEIEDLIYCFMRLLFLRKLGCLHLPKRSPPPRKRARGKTFASVASKPPQSPLVPSQPEEKEVVENSAAAPTPSDSHRPSSQPEEQAAVADDLAADEEAAAHLHE